MEDSLFGEKERGHGCEVSISDEQSSPLQLELAFSHERGTFWKQVIS